MSICIREKEREGAESFPVFSSPAPVIDPGLSWPVSTAELVAMELGVAKSRYMQNKKTEGP